MTDRLPGTKFLIFSLICVVAATYIISVTGNFNRLPFFDEASTFEAVLDEAAGLVVGDDVRIAGVDVGRVNAISVEEGDAVVTFEVEPEIEPTSTWQVGARWRNAIGQRYLYLYPQPGGTDMIAGDLGDGGTGRFGVDRSVEVADLAAFVNALDPLLAAIDPDSQNMVTDALNDVLTGRDATVQSLVTNLSELAATVAGEEPEVRSVIANANLLLSEYNSREDQLTSLIDQLASVSSTLANRSDEVLDAAVDLADVQAQLGDLIEQNDRGLIDSVDNVRQITDSIGTQRPEFEASLASLRQGLASYMLISRKGEWFNVRGVAVQIQSGGATVTCTTETGTQCSFPNTSLAGGGGGGAPSGGGANPAAGPPPIPQATEVSDSGVVEMAPQRLDALQVVTGVPLLRSTDVALADTTQEGDR